jgi:hypothetical protein
MTTVSLLLGQVNVKVGAYDTELVIAGVVSVLLGVLIFLVPRLLNYIVPPA